MRSMCKNMGATKRYRSAGPCTIGAYMAPIWTNVRIEMSWPVPEMSISATKHTTFTAISASVTTHPELRSRNEGSSSRIISRSCSSVMGAGRVPEEDAGACCASGEVIGSSVIAAPCHGIVACHERMLSETRRSPKRYTPTTTTAANTIIASRITYVTR